MTSRKKASKNNNNNNNMLILPIAVGLLTILVGVPATVSFSQQQPDTATITTITTTTNDTTAADNMTQLGDTTNQTTTTTTEDNETLLEQQEEQLQQEQMAGLARSLRENLTSGESRVLMITVASTDAPIEQEQRDIDPLGLVEFTDPRTMSIARPEYASGEEDGLATLYTGGQLTFQIGNVTMEPPDNVDVLFINTDGTDTRIPEVIDDTGEDSEFVIPTGLRDGDTYLVLVKMNWPESESDTMMGIVGRAVNLEERLAQQEATTGNMTTTGNTTAGG
jgi:hypothetical protein